MEPKNTTKVRTCVQIGALALTIAAVEYCFFHLPEGGLRPARAGANPVVRSGEKHLRNIRQLTFGGENAEAYWSFDGKQICFQSTRDNLAADQIFVMNADGSQPRMVSTGKGRTTCSYFLKDGKRLIYASTHLGGDAPPPPPDRSEGYVWPVFPSYDIFSVRPDGTELTRLTHTPGYDAEATVSPNGRRIIFTSMRNGDLDLYSMSTRGGRVRRLTSDLGYDGGAFYSPDGSMICYRANHPESAEEQKAYKDLLARHLVKPNKMELWVMKADGSEKRQVTKNGFANFCPFFTPDGKKLIFASNMDDPRGRPPNFDLYTINLDGTGQERITFDPAFDGFPMFSPDGKKIAWASNRNQKKQGETNVFVADWAP